MRGKANHFCVTRLLGPFESSIFFFIYLLFHRVFTIISVKINPIAANSSDDFMKAIIPKTNAPVAIVSHIKCLFLVFMKVPFLFRFSFVWLPLSLPYNVVPFSPFIISKLVLTVLKCESWLLPFLLFTGMLSAVTFSISGLGNVYIVCRNALMQI